MAGIGGYQAPAHPAAVSGIGANSRRTDGGPTQPIRNLPDANYGENKEYVNLQRTAPLAGGPTPGTPAPSAGSVPQQGPDPTQLISMAAPSARPDEPVTHGADVGPGADSSVLNLPNPVGQAQQNAKQFVDQMAATTGNPAVQYLAANIRGSF